MPADVWVIEFDDGNKVQTSSTSRDMLKLEREGVVLSDLGNIEAGYVLAHAALQRLHRAGKLDFEPPATVEELEEVADITPPKADAEDPEGKG